MLRHDRRLLVDCLFIGAALTLLVIAADASDFLAPLENWLYDLRARTCQYFLPPPSDKLIYLDIDDPALDVLGAWPWPRAKLAQIFDEVRIAAPKAVELDILYSEPQPVQYEPAGEGKYLTIDNDAELAAAIARLGNVIVPATLESVPPQSSRYGAMRDELRKDIELNEATMADRLNARGFEVVNNAVGDQFYLARREAIMQRLAAMKAGPHLSFDQVRAALMPRTAIDVHPGVENVLKEQWDKYLDLREFSRLSFSRPPGIASPTPMRVQYAPIRKFSAAAAGGAFVDYPKFGSAVIRTLPLLLEQDGKVYAQMGLALAARMLDADMGRMRVEGGRLLIPRAGKADIVIPFSPPRQSTDGSWFANLMDIPWFGGRQWEKMYDWPAHKVNKQHLPINEVWQACVARGKIRQNNRLIDDAIRGVYWGIDADDKRIKAYNAAIPTADDFETRQKTSRQLVDVEFTGYLDEFVKLKPAEIAKLDEKAQTFYASLNALKKLLELNPPLIKELANYRADLSKLIKDKAVLVGWTATAAIADFVPTSLHEKCPGVVVHGVVFNAIMTGELWTRAPWWIAAAVAVGAGLLTALAVGYLSPMKGLVVALALAGGYAAVNGLLLFDYGNRIVGAAAPLTAVGIVWAGCTLTRVVVEATERAHITRRFGSYADSKLVDYVLEKGDIPFEGESREVTVVFTDLAGFTSLSERLGEKIVPVLNELLGELVPVIRDSHQGYVNKFMGDGIMFFYNAPMQVRDHAADAVATVLDMHIKLTEFNVRLRERGLPQLAMRGGIATGVVIVGDAGGGGRNDYTCLGDAVNLSSRLEAANKQLGTSTLINDRAAELLNGQFLVRSVGRIQVVGQDQAKICCEPLCLAAAATDEQRKLAGLSGEMVEAFVARRFEDCLRFADQIDVAFGAGKLTAAYRAHCQRYLRDPPPPDFDGRIVLTEK